ncbi:MAG: hypothetical protein MN733_22495 [Nitrososphaera sp.]|nr:hypothetical protein [Nitrososphaera sp.]
MNVTDIDWSVIFDTQIVAVIPPLVWLIGRWTMNRIKNRVEQKRIDQELRRRYRNAITQDQSVWHSAVIKLPGRSENESAEVGKLDRIAEPAFIPRANTTV